MPPKVVKEFVTSWYMTPQSIAFWAPDLDNSATFSPQVDKANTGPELCLLNYIFLHDAFWNPLQMFSLPACQGRKFALTHNSLLFPGGWSFVSSIHPPAFVSSSEMHVGSSVCTWQASWVTAEGTAYRGHSEEAHLAKETCQDPVVSKMD